MRAANVLANKPKEMKMTKFIETADGVAVASTEIVKLEKRGRRKCVIRTRDGEHHMVSRSMKSIEKDIEVDTSIIIPAQSGCFVAFSLYPSNRHKEVETLRLPVVGWRLMKNECVHGTIYYSAPIIAGCPGPLSDWALELPNDKVISSQEEFPMTMKKWLDREKKYYESIMDAMDANDDGEDDHECDSDLVDSIDESIEAKDAYEDDVA